MIDRHHQVAALILELLAPLPQTLIIIDIGDAVDIDLGRKAVEPRLFSKADEANLEALLLDNHVVFAV